MSFQTWEEVEAFVASSPAESTEGWTAVTGWFGRRRSLDLNWQELRQLTLLRPDTSVWITIAVYAAEGVFWRTPAEELAQRLEENSTEGIRWMLANCADVDGRDKQKIIDAYFAEDEPR